MTLRTQMVPPREEDGMFVYRLIFIPPRRDGFLRGGMLSATLNSKGEPVASGSQVLSPVHPFFVLPALWFHTSRPRANDPLMDDFVFFLFNWVSLLKTKVVYQQWVDDGPWPDVVAGRVAPEKLGIAVDVDPEIDLEGGERWERRGSKFVVVSSKPEPKFPAVQSDRTGAPAAAAEVSRRVSEMRLD